MPEHDIIKLKELYTLMERMGIDLRDEATPYVAFIVMHIGDEEENSASDLDLDRLCKRVAWRFGPNEEKVLGSIRHLTNQLYTDLTGPMGIVHPELLEELRKHCGEVHVLRDTKAFLYSLHKAIQE